ncbi:T9SS type A sorting domain-containing protein [Croceibacter atlanticus]|uniref:T9SS type A sorting domain-containing protein n=1 Tax=Croceibacter atlanticus TaxID=313588 RepID=UPI0030F6087F
MKTLIILFFFLTTLYYAQAQDSQLLDKEWTLDHITLDNLNYYPPFENGEGSDSQIEFYDSEVSELVVVFCSFISVVYEFSSTSSEFTTIGSWGGSTNQCFNEDNQNYEGMYYNDFWLTHNDTSNNTFSYNIVTGDDGTMMLTITNENGDQAFYNSAALGVEDNAGQQITIFPNPAEDVFHIINEMPSSISSLTIYNIKGKRILQKDNISKNEIIDVSSLPSGLYLVDVNNTEGHREVIKLVKR